MYNKITINYINGIRHINKTAFYILNNRHNNKLHIKTFNKFIDNKIKKYLFNEYIKYKKLKDKLMKINIININETNNLCIFIFLKSNIKNNKKFLNYIGFTLSIAEAYAMKNIGYTVIHINLDNFKLLYKTIDIKYINNYII